jgi:hypothetical protein
MLAMALGATLFGIGMVVYCHTDHPAATPVPGLGGDRV